jgi:hypothetical protein
VPAPINQGVIQMFKLRYSVLAAAAALSLLALPARAADIAVKAPASPFGFSGSGPFFGIYAEGGGGPVTASVPGVASASLTTTTGAIGLTVGYAHRFANGLLGTVEADACAKNFNGANAGFSAAGPVCLEQRVMLFAPTDAIMNLFSFVNIPNPFNNLTAIVTPPGSTVKNSMLGIGGGAYWNDMTIAYQGVGANKVWSVNPELVIMKQDLITNTSGSFSLLARSFLKVDIQSQTMLFGAGQATARNGVGVRLGLGADF